MRENQIINDIFLSVNNFEATIGNIGEAVVVNVALKDQDDTSPVGKITVTTQNVEKVIFTIVTPDDTAVTKEEVGLEDVRFS